MVFGAITIKKAKQEKLSRELEISVELRDSISDRDSVISPWTSRILFVPSYEGELELASC